MTIEATEYKRKQTAPVKRVTYSALFLLAGVLFPVLIWVGLFGVSRKPILQVARQIAYGALFVLVGISMPVLIWVGYAFAVRHSLVRWREERFSSSVPWSETISKIKVLIVDDHAIMRDGIRAVLALQRDMQVVGDAVNGREALEKTVDFHPNVVLMDILMPEMNGFDATREICRKYPETKVLMLSQYDDRENILTSRQVGALGFVPKKAASQLLLTAIREVSQGKQFMYGGIN